MIAWRAEFYAGRAAWTPPVFCNTPATSTMQYGSHLREKKKFTTKGPFKMIV